MIKDWDYDKKTPLTTEDTSVQVFYSLHGETKTTVIPIYVSEAVYAEPEIEYINNVLSLLPPPDELTANDLQ
ncbi:MAG: hypothetical protein K2G96_03950, partial [Clostridia bacterium]|nr:hypothetical protein [Clostridia bacterium]